MNMVVRQSRHVRGKIKSFLGPTCAQNLTSRMHMKYKQKKIRTNLNLHLVLLTREGWLIITTMITKIEQRLAALETLFTNKRSVIEVMIGLLSYNLVMYTVFVTSWFRLDYT